MSEELAIIGDVHGNLTALEQIVHAAKRRTEILVFVGDYINRGPRSADVIDFLIDLAAGPGQTVLLRGNHEASFLRYLDGGSLGDFLKIGGAATLRSYASADDAFSQRQFRSTVPTVHVEFFRGLRGYFWKSGLLVTHNPRDPIPSELADRTRPIIRVSGHLPQFDRLPSISDHLALIDTGCGTWDDGPLTCLFWPTADWIQAQ